MDKINYSSGSGTFFIADLREAKQFADDARDDNREVIVRVMGSVVAVIVK